MVGKRKLAVCAAMVILAVCANNLHAEETKRDRVNYFSFGPGWLLAASDDRTASGFGITAGWNNPHLFTDRLGLGAYLNVAVPFMEVDVGEDPSGIVVSALIGPSTIAFQRGRFSVPVLLGYHFNYIYASDMVPWAINMGIGGVADAVFQASSRWLIFARVMAAYNFGDGGEFIFMPSLGVGLNF